MLIEYFEKNKFKKEGSVFNHIILNHQINNNRRHFFYRHIYNRSKEFKMSPDQRLWMITYISHVKDHDDAFISDVLTDLSEFEFHKKMIDIIDGLIKNEKIGKENFNKCLALYPKKKTIAALAVKRFNLNNKSFFVLLKKFEGKLSTLSRALGIKSYEEAHLADAKYKDIPKKIKRSFIFIYDPKFRKKREIK